MKSRKHENKGGGLFTGTCVQIWRWANLYEGFRF